MRPIDADALEKRLEETRNAYEVNGYFDNYVFGFDDAWKHIKDAPTIEAEPVRHAKVLYNVAIEKEECCGYKKRKGHVLQKYTCSSCYTAIPGESKFCMECGAKLNWENEDGA